MADEVEVKEYLRCPYCGGRLMFNAWDAQIECFGVETWCNAIWLEDGELISNLPQVPADLPTPSAEGSGTEENSDA